MFRLSLLAFGLLTSLASAQPNFPEPKTYPPDEATLKEIAAKTAELNAAITAIKKPTPDVEIYLKAAQWIVGHREWYTEKSATQTLDVLAAGLARAKAAKEGKAPWLEARGKPIARGYKSDVDNSVQPYSIQYPAQYDPKKKHRIDIVLHGRDSTLTEVKFLAGKETAKADAKLDHFVVEVYGRGNNAYRWAGEADIWETIAYALVEIGAIYLNDSAEIPQVVLRGFSMGGAGTWHYGLHHPGLFSVMGPGAGFTTTRGYIQNLPAKLPEYIEKCLHIYDAVDYAENAFNLPIIAYSGEKDPQKAAADNIQKLLKDFKEPHIFKHLVVPGLEHQQPAEWLAKCDAEYRAILAKGKKAVERVRFVTYTTRYNLPAEWLSIDGLDEHYAKAVLDAKVAKGVATITTANVRRIALRNGMLKRFGEVGIGSVTIDGQTLKTDPELLVANLKKVDGKWAVTKEKELAEALEKMSNIQGPIDDAFLTRFRVVGSSEKPWNQDIDEHVGEVQQKFAELWDKHLRGQLPTGKGDEQANIILFGDPGSNPAIAAILPKLPIKWSKDALVVNGVKYDAKTHYPALIYPNPKNPNHYIVLNSGHTFKDADFRGTNALLYPRLGDWAVLKPKPTNEDPGAVEVVAAGIFDEFWQFKKVKK